MVAILLIMLFIIAVGSGVLPSDAHDRAYQSYLASEYRGQYQPKDIDANLYQGFPLI